MPALFPHAFGTERRKVELPFLAMFSGLYGRMLVIQLPTVETISSLLLAALPTTGSVEKVEDENQEVPIPGPAPYPLIGNLPEIAAGNVIDNIHRMCDTYGPIYQFRVGNAIRIIVSGRELATECCDEKRFHKSVNGPLNQVRNGVGDGLFTARHGEPRWAIAHRILIPAFGPVSMRGMFDEMHDIASQLILKWARGGPNASINVSDDFTRLTLDTLALCSMDFRFNSYYSEAMHPFIGAMGDFLAESSHRFSRLGLVAAFKRADDQKYWADIEIMRKTALDVLNYRRENPSSRKDLLTAMLEGVDLKTGQKMDDDSIINNLITFLIAGHETTSGLLSFATYELLKYPETYQKAQEEVDRICGRDPITVDHLSKLPYLNAVLRETLRIDSPIPGFPLEAKEETLLGGKYRVYPNEVVTVILKPVHLDPIVYAPDPNVFRPERMLDAEFDARMKKYPNCWKPFGNGMRACIGRPFAWQEALLALALILQNFNLIMDDPSYSLQLKHSLTTKPYNFKVRAMLRHEMNATELERHLSGGKVESTQRIARSVVEDNGKGQPISIYYGSNSGTCESMAHRLAADAGAHGFRSKVVDVLDAAKEKLPKDHPVVIITASYEGQPTNNASSFIAWLESLKGKEAEGVNYAVYGCGHRDWVSTFLHIPKLVDQTLETIGGQRIVEMGSTDAADRDVFSDFELWEDTVLWPTLVEKYGAEEVIDEAGLSVSISHPRTENLYYEVKECVVIENRVIATGESPKKHIEIELPNNITYRAGDYLAVLPHNPAEIIGRIIRRFELNDDAWITITGDTRTHLPVGKELPIKTVLSAYVELAQPATKRNILALAKACTDAADQAKLQALTTDKAYPVEVTQKRLSMIDLLEEYPLSKLPFGSFLAMLPPMRVRLYSISSSPLHNPNRVTLTYSILDQPALSGKGRYIGTASNYLSNLTAGDRLHVSVKPSPDAFHLPNDPETTPIVCIAAGSGIAPFRGFIQERAVQIASGRKLAPAILYFGCRSPEYDDCYAEEFAEWEKQGAVTLRKAYSRDTGKSDGHKYVQYRLYADKGNCLALWKQGAKGFVCGSGKMGKDVEKVGIRILMEVSKEKGVEISEEEARTKFASMRNDRYATDVFD